MQDRETSNENHRRFVERVVDKGQVWGLKSDQGWAICASIQFENAKVMPFWSDPGYARRAAKHEWSRYEPSPIALDVFIDRWLAGLHRDDVLVGTNWDAQNCGLEVDAERLGRELLDEMERRG
jgi:hypothetical protein